MQRGKITAYALIDLASYKMDDDEDSAKDDSK